MTTLFFEFLKHVKRANDSLRGAEPVSCIDFYGDPRQACSHGGGVSEGGWKICAQAIIGPSNGDPNPDPNPNTLTLTKAINGHNGAMPDATAVIRAYWPGTVMLGKTISERLPKAVIEFIMETLVRKFPEVFDINGITEEILPAAGLSLGAGSGAREGRREREGGGEGWRGRE